MDFISAIVMLWNNKQLLLVLKMNEMEGQDRRLRDCSGLEWLRDISTPPPMIITITLLLLECVRVFQDTHGHPNRQSVIT